MAAELYIASRQYNKALEVQLCECLCSVQHMKCCVVMSEHTLCVFVCVFSQVLVQFTGLLLIRDEAAAEVVEPKQEEREAESTTEEEEEKKSDEETKSETVEETAAEQKGESLQDV